MKKVYSLILFFFIILFITSQVKAVGDPYWPWTDNSWIEYRVSEIEATWYNDSKILEVNSRTYLNTQRITIEHRTCSDCWGDNIVYHQVYAGGGSVGNGGNTVDNRFFYGEAVDHNGAVHIPFLPKLSRDKTIGQTLEVTSKVRESCDNCVLTGASELLKWRLISGGNWGEFEDTYRTGLVDCNSAVFNYVFMKDVGMVNFWYVIDIPGDPCEPGGTCTGTGYEFYAIDWGGQ